jgi:MFS family permease
MACPVRTVPYRRKASLAQAFSSIRRKLRGAQRGFCSWIVRECIRIFSVSFHNLNTFIDTFCNPLSKIAALSGYIRRVLQEFRTPKMGVILLLGFSSGLPLYLTSRTLQAWRTVAGVNLTAIGLFSLVSLPYSVKFLWSPLIDRFRLPFLGRRKGWLIATQVALAGSIAGMALARPAQALRLLALNTLAIAFFSATQDITVDAYAADVCSAAEIGAGSSTKVLGYRIAMIATGGGALIMADFVSWPSVYAVFGLIMLLLALASARIPEPAFRDTPPSTMAEAVRLPLSDFFRRLGRVRGGCILAFILLYRLGETMIDRMTTPFLLQIGFTQTDVGIVQGGVGLAATIAGVLARGSGYQPCWIEPIVVGFWNPAGSQQPGLPLACGNRTQFCFDGGRDHDREFLRGSGNSCPRRASDGALQSALFSNTIRAALEPCCDRPRCHGCALRLDCSQNRLAHLLFTEYRCGYTGAGAIALLRWRRGL